MEGTEVDRWTAGLGSASHGARAIDSGAKVVFFASTIVANRRRSNQSSMFIVFLVAAEFLQILGPRPQAVVHPLAP
jgi:hypothetical protein